MTDDAPQRKKPTRNRELTTAQKHALDRWLAYESEHGYPPSGADLARLLEVTRQQAHSMVNILRDKGFIAPRRITITRLKSTAKARKMTP